MNETSDAFQENSRSTSRAGGEEPKKNPDLATKGSIGKAKLLLQKSITRWRSLDICFFLNHLVPLLKEVSRVGNMASLYNGHGWKCIFSG